ncbi:MAG: phosphohydrolase [Desulforhopalus sp.]
MKCPGQDMKYWKEDAIFDVNCPKCNNAVEFYKDDTSRKCNSCGYRFVNPKLDFGCASYCQFAEQCLGTLPDEFTGGKEDLLKDKVAVEMKRFFQTDFKAIRQATTAARHAENIGKAEGGNLAVILCAAYLHGTDRETARQILGKVGAGEQMTGEICAILDALEDLDETAALPAKIVHDALAINRLQEQIKESRIDMEKVHKIFQQILFTASARAIAGELVA